MSVTIALSLASICVQAKYCIIMFGKFTEKNMLKTLLLTLRAT